jgi:hypothetical protein
VALAVYCQIGMLLRLSLATRLLRCQGCRCAQSLDEGGGCSVFSARWKRIGVTFWAALRVFNGGQAAYYECSTEGHKYMDTQGTSPAFTFDKIKVL